jgi:hypothetical protein
MKIAIAGTRYVWLSIVMFYVLKNKESKENFTVKGLKEE